MERRLRMVIILLWRWRTFLWRIFNLAFNLCVPTSTLIFDVDSLYCRFYCLHPSGPITMLASMLILFTVDCDLANDRAHKSILQFLFSILYKPERDVTFSCRMIPHWLLFSLTTFLFFIKVCQVWITWSRYLGGVWIIYYQFSIIVLLRLVPEIRGQWQDCHESAEHHITIHHPHWLPLQ